jgi:hypothetical protein
MVSGMARMQAGILLHAYLSDQMGQTAFSRHEVSRGEMGSGMNAFGKGADLSAYFRGGLERVVGGIFRAG